MWTRRVSVWGLMGILGCVVLAVGACAPAWGATAASSKTNAVAAYVAKFHKYFHKVSPAPAFADYATVARYDKTFMGKSLDHAIRTESNNDNGALAWGLSYRMASLNTMYTVTHNPKYLEANLKCIRAVLAQRDNVRGIKLWTGEIAPAWGCNKYAPQRGRCVFTVHTGVIVSAILNCLELVKHQPAMRAKLGGEFQRILTACEKALAFHDREWRIGPHDGEGYYAFLHQEINLDNKPQPANRQSAIGCALWDAWKLSGKTAYRDRAEAIGRYMRRRLTPSPDGAYYWSYYLPEDPVTKPASKDSIDGEDGSHAGLTIALPCLLAQDGVVFTKDDMKRLANMVLFGFAKRTDGVMFPQITGGTHLSPSYVGSPAHYLRLAQYNPQVRARILPFYLNYIASPGADDLALLLRYGK